MKPSEKFPPATVRVIEKRSGSMCAYPNCLATTSGPSNNDRKFVNIGEACHITAAKRSGPRYEETLTPEQRNSAENGIWMCRTHAALIDRDVERYTKDVLIEWKNAAEERASSQLGRPQGCATGYLASVSPVTRLGAQQTVVIDDERFPFTYIFDPDDNNERVTCFVAAIVVQFSIQKNYYLKSAVLEHLVVTVHETKPIPKIHPLFEAYPAETNLFYVQISPNNGITRREFRPTRYYHQATQEQSERHEFPPAIVLDNDAPAQIALRLNADEAAMYLVSIDASIAAGAEREILPVMIPQWIIFDRNFDDDSMQH